MGSPLSGVLACLFLEFLEAGPFINILPKNSLYLRYIDDILLICPQRTDIEKLTTNLNKIEDTINFTHEEEINNTLPFLDVMIHRKTPNLEFSVYRKPTYKNDLLHYFSHHDKKIKRGMIIGFYLRAHRICSDKYLQDELTHIDSIFTDLRYPRYFIQHAKTKAKKIHNTPRTRDEEPNPRYLLLPTNSQSETIQSSVHPLKVAYRTSTTIKQIVQTKREPTHTDAAIYKIPCHDCNEIYIGETSRPLIKRIYEHKRALRIDDDLNAVAKHRTTMNHSINMNEATILHKEQNSKRRKLLESAAILAYNTFDQRPGSYQLPQALAHKLLRTHRIPTPNLT